VLFDGEVATRVRLQAATQKMLCDAKLEENTRYRGLSFARS
jgi:hypothetical protein